MVRSAAKNHAFVTILTDPADYDELIAEMEESGGATSYDFRRKCAAKAYAATAAYDGMISQWFAFADQGQTFPDMLAVNGYRSSELRYGENPHQKAALYLPVGPHGSGIAQAEQVQGKELSYNNYNDADAALELVSEFRDGPPIAWRWNATACPPLAASLRSTGHWMAPPPKRSPKFSPKSLPHPQPTMQRKLCLQRRRICACC